MAGCRPGLGKPISAEAPRMPRGAGPAALRPVSAWIALVSGRLGVAVVRVVWHLSGLGVLSSLFFLGQESKSLCLNGFIKNRDCDANRE